MSSFYSRIQKRIRMTKDNYDIDMHFSRTLANYHMIDDLSWRMHLYMLSERYHQKKDEWILNYLHQSLAPVFEKYSRTFPETNAENNAPIWVCWWSGEETAPELVKQCIKSIRANAGTHPVHLITESNHRDYLEIPDYILNKVQNKQMCIANFTDYLRVSLIEKYGGLWLDSTIYCARPIPETYFELPFFTCKGNPVKTRYLSKFRWTGFCLGGHKHYVFYRYMKEALENYWGQESVSIDYLLADYLIESGYQYIPEFHRALDQLAPNNPHRDDLQAAMNAALPASAFDQVIQEDTTLYKLSWRETYSETTEHGSESVYGWFLHQ